MRLAVVLLAVVPVLPLHSQLLPVDSVWVEETLKRMTLEEKVGQLIMPPHFDVLQSLELIQKYKVGGFWFAKAKPERSQAS